MSIPKYDEIMLPLLKILSDGKTHTKRELTEKIADHFQLTQEERGQMLPSTRAIRWTFTSFAAHWKFSSSP